MATTTSSISSDADPEALGPGPLAQLAAGDEPALVRGVHAATAWRNSSDSVGGW